jgi:PEP-CTERM motif
MTAAGLKGQIHIDANDASWVMTLGKSVLSSDGGGIPTPGVAEPATWAMMMLGFVGLGAVADRKRAAFKAA